MSYGALTAVSASARIVIGREITRRVRPFRARRPPVGVKRYDPFNKIVTPAGGCGYLRYSSTIPVVQTVRMEARQERLDCTGPSDG